jgi:PIN domain nuclease of toxin-antitoxin system
MRLLLDTHIVLWCLDDDPRLSAEAWTSIETAEAVWVSSASLWEAAIKYQLGRLSVPPERLAEGLSASGFLELPIRFQHAVAVSRLPTLHRDPFDRLLLAQAISEPLHLMTADEQLAPYSPLVQLV